MKALVTGSAGFICGYLVEELLQAGYEVVGVDNFSKYGRVEKSYDKHPHYRFVEANCKDVSLLKELLSDCDHFVASAAMIGGISYFHEFAYDLLAAQSTPLGAAKEYLRILKLAKDEGEQRVELVLRQLVRAGSGTLSSEAVRQALAEGACCTTCVDAVRIPAVDLGSYDALLTHAPSAVQSVTEANHA